MKYFSVAYFVEALPLVMPSDFAAGTGDASVDEVCECYYRQCRSYHRAPSFRSTSYIDSRITPQIWVFVFTIKVLFTGINMSFILFVGVVLNFIFGHGITSLVCCGWCYYLLDSKNTACSGFGNVSRLAGGWEVKTTNRQGVSCRSGIWSVK
jgi:hypothetical protein